MKIAPDTIGTSLSLLVSATESTEPLEAQEKVEQLRAALLRPNPERIDLQEFENLCLTLSKEADIHPALRVLAPLIDLRLSVDSEMLTQALASLKSMQDTSPINELLADGLKIQCTDLRKLANAAGIDLAPYQFLAQSDGALLTVLDKRSGEDPDELAVTKDDKYSYCDRASKNPAALACLINHFIIRLSELSRMGLAESNLEKSLPFLHFCDLRDIDPEKQAAWLLKANPSKLRCLYIQSDRIKELPATLPLLKWLKCSNCTQL
ncbi:MAG: hypothetical protein KDK78_04695, partial [Chlamydiia bacterium]|nr:hypothetical protein [Chlamydiia bacterium]